ncbi:MAG: outer membrane beta-barrel protein [Xanthobacteraceae bacterium]
MKMKQILLSGACVAAIAAAMAASASAADLSPRPVYKAPPMAAAPQFSWTGCYVGGNAGYGMASRTWNAIATTPVTTFVSQHTSGGGFVGGGQLGCDYQSGNWVVGIEGMVDGSTIDRNTSIGNVLPGASLTDKVTSFETLTGRLGWAADRSLFYVKAGAAWDQTTGAINAPAGFSSESHSATNSGWVAGGGWEYAFTPQWSGKIEYDYMGFGNQSVAYPLTTAGSVNFTHQNLQTILAGLNFRFNSGGR